MGDTVQEVMDLCKKATVSDLYIHEDPSYDALALLVPAPSAFCGSNPCACALESPVPGIDSALVQQYKAFRRQCAMHLRPVHQSPLFTMT